ncbi:hypothetical protein HA402_007516 [Bradysia odoriphaga]|nr:hypothetical protein HA402_007516 [Bradysia odoriphaga]
MSSKIILYHLSLSPPVRSVLLTAKALGIELVLRNVNLLEGDHLKPEFIKVNAKGAADVQELVFETLKKRKAERVAAPVAGDFVFSKY